MQIFWTWGAGWYYILAVAALVWIFLAIYRKDRGFKKQVLSAATFTAFAFIIELIGISNGIWSYDTGAWPVILWPTYFISGLAVYQLAMLVHDL